MVAFCFYAPFPRFPLLSSFNGPTFSCFLSIFVSNHLFFEFARLGLRQRSFLVGTGCCVSFGTGRASAMSDIETKRSPRPQLPIFSGSTMQRLPLDSADER
ncbi:uncharacterized protein K452DRAFT_134791 [Aplosporella prunicola CBS 121167]|uniref:Uncharacterized protein n=1 Tax=Aplosporella prunicola CBS 121167 TaxID=1176127 RepID=A0A6A6BLY1_9PEZI|nr:uncharacterized protein K452DRAFT_134791 [Aplosporella prunicola CBS 121167]KAF2145119.1 hypothetical protein K452DRAFT_134791 [Aplosporella prunicola CBS 121167]